MPLFTLMSGRVHSNLPLTYHKTHWSLKTCDQKQSMHLVSATAKVTLKMRGSLKVTLAYYTIVNENYGNKVWLFE